LFFFPIRSCAEPSKPVERVDDDLRRFADDMLETMYDAPGIGLAAVQVGEPIRMLVMDVSKEDEENRPLRPHQSGDRGDRRRGLDL
jgi:peptide deformylase